MRETDGRVGNNVYFAGRLIKRGSNPLYSDNNFVAVDQLGSVRAAIENSTVATTTSYLPYGEELSSTGNDTTKFATYTRDGSTGLDYADQRYYTSQFGRFMSADRYRQAAKANDSGSWNKYSYVQNDPVNYYDPSGESRCSPDGPCRNSSDGPGGVGWPGNPTPCTAEDPRLATPACLEGNGGEGSPGGGAKPISSAADAKQDLLDALSAWSDCAKLVGGLSVADQFANGMTFVSGASGGNLGMAGNSNNTPFSVYQAQHPGVDATTLLNSQNNPSQTVVLWNLFFHGDSATDQKVTLVHEFFHSITGISNHYTLDVALGVESPGWFESFRGPERVYPERLSQQRSIENKWRLRDQDY